jgi:hypothetical protein
MSADRCAAGHRPVRWPRYGQQVSATRAASPVGVRTRAAQRPSAMAALRRTRPPWCPAAGRVDRWADTPTMTVPARRMWGAVGVRPPRPPRRWGRTATEPAADTRTVPPPPSVVAVRVPDTRRQPAATRHRMRRDVTATGTCRRGAAAGRMEPTLVGAAEPDGQAAAELAADVGHRRAGERAGLLEAEVVDLQPGDLAVSPAADDRLGDLLRVDAKLRPGVLGPGAQLHRQVSQEDQLTWLAFWVAGEQLIDQAAGRLGNPRMQHRGRPNDQDRAGLGSACGSRGRSRPR